MLTVIAMLTMLTKLAMLTVSPLNSQTGKSSYLKVGATGCRLAQCNFSSVTDQLSPSNPIQSTVNSLLHRFCSDNIGHVVLLGSIVLRD
jgi:hypothetical protein